MAVIGIAGERPDSPKGSFELGKFRVTRKFLVLTNNYLDGPGTVALAPGIPLLYSPYLFGKEFLPFLRCRSVEAERLAPNSLQWEVTCVYETPDPKDGGGGEGGHASDPKGDPKQGDGGGTGQDTDGQFDNPLLMIPEVETHSETHKEVIYGVYDVLSQQLTPVAASTGEVYVPAPERDRSDLVVTITRNESILSPYPAQSILYQDAINSDVFWGANPGQVKCKSITVVRQVKNLPDGSQVPYLKVTYVFHFRDTWNQVILDKGSWYWYKPGDTQDKSQWKKKKFMSDDNQNIDGLLDGQGGSLPQGNTPVFLTLQVYPMLPFGLLGLPQSFTQVQ